jgi:CRP-like cAMP-binding protein
MNRDIDILSKMYMFRQVPPNDISELCSQAQPLSFGTGDIVYRRGEASNGGLLILSGSLNAYILHGSKQRDLGNSKPGEIVGETGIFAKGSNRTANVKAAEPTRCLVIDDNLLHATGNNQAILAIETYLISSIARRIRKNTQSIQIFWREMEKQEAMENDLGKSTKKVSFRTKFNRFFGGNR